VRAETPPLPLADAVRELRKYYGKPPGPISTDPFRLVLWEQVAYLVPDAQRLHAYDALRTQVGLNPTRILAAPRGQLLRIARLGGAVAATARADRIRRSAETALAQEGGSLRSVLRVPLPQARRILASFPMIGAPGADKILVFSRRAKVLPLDSNGLRVLQRLGLAPLAKNYSTAYRRAQEALEPELPRTCAALGDAYALLRQHGQELCRRGVPRCGQCPLRPRCPTGRAS